MKSPALNPTVGHYSWLKIMKFTIVTLSRGTESPPPLLPLSLKEVKKVKYLRGKVEGSQGPANGCGGATAREHIFVANLYVQCVCDSS